MYERMSGWAVTTTPSHSSLTLQMKNGLEKKKRNHRCETFTDIAWLAFYAFECGLVVI